MTPTGPSSDETRFTLWAREHSAAVRGYVFGLVRRADVADDLAQEVFCRAWQARRRYREQGNARAYLLRIADRLVVDHYRKSGREATLGEDGWGLLEPLSTRGEPAAEVARSEAAEQLNRAMEELSPDQRRVLLLRYYGQLSFAEIAEIVECPLSTALSHSHRGLTALKRLLVEDPR